MRKILILLCLTLLNFSNALAVSLYDALNQTYQNNIKLNAERESLKASEEDVNISKSAYKPSLTLSGSKSKEDTNKLTNQSGGNATINDVDPFTTSIKLEQTILDFSRGLELKKSITGLDLAKQVAAHAAISDHVTSDVTVIGIGSGSTIVFAVQKLVEIYENGKNFIC